MPGLTGAEGAKTMKVTPVLKDGFTSQIGLYLSPDGVTEKTEQGIAALALCCGDAELTVELSAMDAGNYPGAEAIDCYVFALAPAEEGLMVTAEALCGDKRIPAGSLGGVTLRVGNTETAITGSGVYGL